LKFKVVSKATTSETGASQEFMKLKGMMSNSPSLALCVSQPSIHTGLLERYCENGSKHQHKAGRYQQTKKVQESQALNIFNCFSQSLKKTNYTRTGSRLYCY